MRIIGDLTLAGFGQLKNARIENVSADPTTPQSGQIWYNSTDNVYRGFTGTEVIQFATGGSTQAILDALSAETTTRQNADTAIMNALAAESTARAAADTTNSEAIAAESTARLSAISALNSAMGTETSQRQAADTILQQNIDTEVTARTAAYNSAVASVATETSARQAADTTLQQNIDAEVTARQAADSTLTANLAAEVSAREAADTTLTTNLNAEITARQAADTAEASAREAADSQIRTDFAAADVVVSNAATAAVSAEASARQAADDLRVLKAGDSMSGNLAFGGTATVTGLKTPENGSDAATKNYADSLVSGLSWKQAVDGSGDTLPATAVAGFRFLNFTDGKIYVATSADTFNAGTAGVDGDAVFDRSNETGYVFSGTAWTQFTGTGQVAAGIGLSKNGNQIDVNLGAGIAQLPSDEVGVDVRSTGGLFLTVDGVAPSTDSAAQLSVRLADMSLEVGANGIAVSSAIQSAVSANTAAIAAETTARAAADTAETSAREAADATLTSNLAAEVTARTAADATLTANLAAEVTARQAATDANASAIATETTARQAADATLQQNIDAEVTARTSAVSGLAAALATETTARQAADDGLTAALAAEVTARQAAISGVHDEVVAEATARDAAIAVETTARINAINAITSAVAGGYFLYNGDAASVSHTVNHNLGSKYCQVLVVDSNDKVIIPDSITFVTDSQLTVEFISAITCKVVVSAPKKS